MGDPKNPEVGDSIIDASDLKLVDLSLEQIKKASKLHDGFETALNAIRRSSEDVKKRCKIDPEELARLEVVLANYKQAQQFVAPLAKLMELVSETIIANRSELAVFITDTANASRDRHDREAEGKATAGKESIPGVLGDLFKYQFGPAIQAALTRVPFEGAGDERLGLMDTLRAYTAGGAWAAHGERLTGRLVAGLAADLVMIDGDIEAIAATDLGTTGIALTIVGGRITHRGAGFGVEPPA